MTANRLEQWCRLLVGGLVRAGMTDMVVSPGSRSTPLVFAADREPGLRLHDVIDERSAGFFALGQARMTGRPTGLLCTSGTAAAHYLPAVMEAKAFAVPLVILTADRPFELHGCRAPQTVDQLRLFGHHAVGFFELGLPDDFEPALASVRRIAAQAMLMACHPEPGAVQINVRARKPLEPSEPDDDASKDLVGKVDALLSRPVVARPPKMMPDPSALDAAAALLDASPSRLLACGPGPVRGRDDKAAFTEAVYRLAQITGAPVIPEAASQLRFGPVPERIVRADDYDLLLRVPERWPDLVPDVLIQVQNPLTSAPWLRFCAAHPEMRRIVLTEGPWADPDNQTDVLLVGDVTETLRGLAERLQVIRPFETGTKWASTQGSAWPVVSSVLESEAGLSEGAAVRALVGGLSEHSVLMLGNSLPIRHVETYCPAASTALDVIVQRGVNGIDGLVSGAAGAAQASGRPTLLILGDVSFLHDAGGLHAASSVDTPLVLAVINNRGGRIFEMLPVSQVPNAPMDRFTTPHDRSLAALAQSFQVPYAAATTRAELDAALETALGRSGATVLEIQVPPSGAIELSKRLVARLKETI